MVGCAPVEAWAPLSKQTWSRFGGASAAMVESVPRFMSTLASPSRTSTRRRGGERDAEELEQARQYLAHDEMLGGVLALVAPPGHEQQRRDAVEEVQRPERVERHAETRVLHDDDRRPPGEVGAGRHAERRVLARLAEVELTALELGEQGLHQRAGHPHEEVEASGEEAVDEAIGRDAAGHGCCFVTTAPSGSPSPPARQGPCAAG